MSDSAFQDRLARLLDGELSEEEGARFWKEVLADEQALAECLQARELDHDLRRLLGASSSDPAFLRGVLGATSESRKSDATFVREVVDRAPRRWRPNRRGPRIAKFAVAAAGLFVALLLLVTFRGGEPPRTAVVPSESRDPEAWRRAQAERVEAELDRKAKEAHLAELRRKEQEASLERERRDPADLPRQAEEAFRKARAEREAAEAGLLEAQTRELRAVEEAVRLEPKPVPDVRPATTGVTVAHAARIGRVVGEAYVAGKAGRAPAVAGQGISAGDGVDTVGLASSVVLSYPDQTRLEVMGGTRVREILDLEPRAGKRLRIEAGTVKAEVARQPKDRPMVFATPHGDAKVVGTVLRLTVDPDPKKGTAVEVEEGRVDLRNAAGRTVEIQGGQVAVAAAGLPLVARPLPREDVLLRLDFEDGKLPPIVEQGTLDRGPDRPGSRACLAGAVDPAGVSRVYIGDGAQGFFTYTGEEILSFDYWVEPTAAGVNFNVYDRTQVRNLEGVAPNLVLGKWTHVSVRLADLGAPSEGDLLVSVYLQGVGGASPVKKFYVDNLQFTRPRILRPAKGDVK